MLGCPTHGVVSRFAIINASSPPSLGPEQRLLNAPAGLCSQFGVNGIAHLLFSADLATLYVSVGSGANDNAPDVGNFGGDPCGAGVGLGAPVGGAFRAQLGASLDGAVLALSGSALFEPAVANGTLAISVVAKGLNSPWRMSFGADAGALYLIDTGFAAIEELNRVDLSLAPANLTAAPGTMVASANNFGFPCVNGNGALLSDFAQLGPCPAAAAAGNAAFTSPRIFLNHPLARASFSALAFDAGRARWLIGDNVRAMVYSVPANFSVGLPDGSATSGSMPMPGSRDAVRAGIVVEAQPAFASHLAAVAAPDSAGAVTLLLVDVVKGTVKSSDRWLNVWAEPSASPGPVSSRAGAAPAISLAAAAAALVAFAATAAML